MPYKTFYLGNVRIISLGSLDSKLGDEIRNFKSACIDYPKLVIDSFLSYYNELGEKYDGLLFIPSNKNETIMEFFAKEISNIANIPLLKNITFKKKIKEQKLLETLDERKSNVSESFVINDSHNLKNKKLIIIDDVYASGETIKELLREFYKAGIDEKNIDIVIFALREDFFNN